MKPNQRTIDFMIWWFVPGGFVLVSAIYPLADPDTWWHLAAGRLILDGQFPLTNTLSHTFPDYRWRFTQWLFGTLIALAEKVGGFFAIQFIVEFPAAVPMWAIVVGFLTSAIVGLVAGLWPAIRAARLDPVEAIRGN